MKKVDIKRINLKKLEMGEKPLTLKKCEYEAPVVKDGYLVDSNGNKIGTKGDMYTKQIMDHILQDGCFDENPRPHYEDYYEGASYDKKNNVIITKDGEKIEVGANESVHISENGVKHWVPAHTLRPIATKASFAEILWIYQKESNDLVVFDELLNRKTWDQDQKVNNWWVDWALRDQNGEFVKNEEGHPTIGAVYGETVKRRHMLKEEVINALKKNPDGRRNITCLWQQDDFNEPHGLKPCAFLTIWNVRHGWDKKDYLDMTMVQRSSDFATAGCINQVQYVALQKMVAKDLGLNPGTFTWKPVNVQIYDRHIEQAIDLLNREPVNCKAEIALNDNIHNFDDFTPDDIQLVDYPREKIKTKNPQLKFPLGI